MQAGYWATHPYTKASVLTIEEFDGWDFMLRLVEECRNTPYKAPAILTEEAARAHVAKLIRRDQALIATLFETGGRVSEVVQLRRHNFKISRRWIRVTGMRVLKRFRKVGEYVDASGRKRWITEPIYVTRGRFSIPIDEPLVPYMLDWIREADDYLFPSPAPSREHLSRVRAYQIVRAVGKRLGRHIWPHYFRSQRASQLAEDYEFTLHEQIRFFSWKNLATADRYAKLSSQALERRMRPEWTRKVAA